MKVQYKTKWSGLTKQQKYVLSKELEDTLAIYLVNKCGFEQVIPTRDSIVTIAKGKNLILPDLMGIHKNGTEYFIELKCKNRRMFINDNGIDYDKVDVYLEVQKEFNKRVLLVFLDDEKEWRDVYPDVESFFKDEENNCVYYGNFLDVLNEHTPENSITISENKGQKIKCFPLKDMKKIDSIFVDKQTTLNFGVIMWVQSMNFLNGTK